MNDSVNIRNVEKSLKALGHPHRLKIMEVVKRGEWIGCEEIIPMFKLSQSTISHHLKQLVDANLLTAKKEGRNCKYQINRKFLGEMSRYLNGFCVTAYPGLINNCLDKQMLLKQSNEIAKVKNNNQQQINYYKNENEIIKRN